MRSATLAKAQPRCRGEVLRDSAPRDCPRLRRLIASLAGIVALTGCGEDEVAWQLVWEDEFTRSLGGVARPLPMAL